MAAESGRWLVSLPGGARRALPSEEGVRTRSIAWLPDSRHIVIAEETTRLIGSRIIIQDTRSTARRVVVNSVDQIEGVTTTDAARLVYAGGPVERDLVEYTGEGKYVRTIAGPSILEDQIEGFSFSPDGSRVLLTLGGDRNDLWMAEGFARPATFWNRWFAHWESPRSHAAR